MRFGRRPLCGFCDVVLGVHLGDDVVDLLLGLGHHLASLLAELVGAADRRLGVSAAPIFGTYFGASIAATPIAMPGSSAASNKATPTATTPTVAATVTTSLGS